MGPVGVGVDEIETQVIEDDGINSEDLMSDVEEEKSVERCEDKRAIDEGNENVNDFAEGLEPCTTQAQSTDNMDEKRGEPKESQCEVKDGSESGIDSLAEENSNAESCVPTPELTEGDNNAGLDKDTECDTTCSTLVDPDVTCPDTPDSNENVAGCMQTPNGFAVNVSAEMKEESVTAGSASTGKLRSSVADAAGMVLAGSYRKCLMETEEFALEYMTRELHHPVISCFRELTRSDVSHIIGNAKLKKSCNSLELSVIYLGLLDLFATVNNNPLYGDNCNSKFSKNISGFIQKILLDFKNIIGSWALSGSTRISNRYTVVLSYLRRLVPMFKTAGFDQELTSIIDSIDKEISRYKSNQEKIKAMSGSTSMDSENSIDKKIVTSEPQDGEPGELRSALNEILVNISFNGKQDNISDDEDVSVIAEDKSKIFGKPLKPSPKTTDGSVKKPRKPRVKTDSSTKNSGKSTDKNRADPKPVAPKSVVTNASNLASVFSTSSPKSTSSKSKEKPLNKTIPAAKRNADGEVTKNSDSTKKPRLDESTSPVAGNKKTNIKSFFQVDSAPKPTVCVSASPSETNVTTVTSVTKPAINAFAMMMNRSRELAQKKKIDKLNGGTHARIDTVKT